LLIIPPPGERCPHFSIHFKSNCFHFLAVNLWFLRFNSNLLVFNKTCQWLERDSLQVMRCFFWVETWADPSFARLLALYIGWIHPEIYILSNWWWTWFRIKTALIWGLISFRLKFTLELNANNKITMTSNSTDSYFHSNYYCHWLELRPQYRPH